MQHYGRQYSVDESSSLLHWKIGCLVFTRFVPVAAVPVQFVFLFILNQVPSPQCRETSQGCEHFSKSHRK